MFAKGVDKDTVVLMAARASRLENQDAIDTAIVSMLSDPKEVQPFLQLFSSSALYFYLSFPIDSCCNTMEYQSFLNNEMLLFCD